jgi:hypothetical protein
VSLSLLSLIFLNGPVVDKFRLSLEADSAFWFRLVKYSGYAVAFGCVLEAPETFVTIKRWWLLRFRDVERDETEKDKRSWFTPIAAAGLINIVLGIVVETYCEGKVSDVDSDIRTYESDKITAAEGEAAAAIRDAGTAKSSAREAATASTIAQGASSTAVVLASGARKEADSLTREIDAANRQAADAVSRLADAEQRLANSTQREAAAEAKLSAIKTPRSLIRTKELVDALKVFKGTEFTMNAFMDQESNRFSVIVARALKDAGWIRRQPAGINLGIPTMKTVFEESEKAENVPSCLDTGIMVHITEKESLAELQTRPFPSLSQTLRAGLALQGMIGPNISPLDENNVGKGGLDPEPGEEKLRICIGKKP